MTRKHFEAIAEQIEYVKDVYTMDIDERAILSILAGRLADSFEEFNANFDRKKFLAACGF